jgi:hypothetical protein
LVARPTPIAQSPPLVYASGHDHGLQVIEGRQTAGTLVVSGAGEPEVLQGIEVSANFFDLLGELPVMLSDVTPAEATTSR